MKPALKKLCEKDPSNWDKYINQVLASYRITPNLATAETPFLLVYGRDPNLPLHQLLEPMQWFLGDPDSGMINLEAHRLSLAIAKKTSRWKLLFKTAQKTMDRQPPSFKIGDRVYFKNKATWQVRPQVETRLQNCLYWAWWTLPAHRKPSNRKVQSCNVKGCSSWTSIEFWNIDTQFGRAGKYVNHPANLPTIISSWLNDNHYPCT